MIQQHLQPWVDPSTATVSTSRVIKTTASKQEKRIRNLKEKLRQVQDDVLKISSFERERIGHELHDDLQQDLAGIACLSKRLGSKLDAEGSDFAALAKEITNELSAAVERIRTLSHELTPYQVEKADLVSCLKKLANDTRRRTGITVNAELDTSIRIEDISTRLHLYRMSQEAIRNAIRHGQATEINIRLHHVEEGRCRLAIEDNGLGLHRDLPEADGIGIRLMQYRSRQIGASLSLRNTGSGGAIVECCFPRPQYP